MFVLLYLSVLFVFSQTNLNMERPTKEEEGPIQATSMDKKQEVKHQKELAKQATAGGELSCLSLPSPSIISQVRGSDKK